MPSVPSAADLGGLDADGPELVSLDDLLAEEESGGTGWDRSWQGEGRDDRLN